MRAYAVDRPGNIADVTLHELPIPKPGPHDLLVRVRGASVNPLDLRIIQWISSSPFLHAKEYPLIIGYDFSGNVREIGPAVSERAVGDEVYGFLPYARSTRGGSFADYLVVDARTVGKKPKSVSHAGAAALATAAATALQAFGKAKTPIAPGTSVFINGGSGGVGCLAVQIGKILGARVVANASAAKHEFVKSLGADVVYDYKTASLEMLAEATKSGAEQYDLLIDVVSNSSYRICAPLLKSSGTFVSLLPSPGLFLAMGLTAFSSKKIGFVMVKPIPSELDQVADWIDEGKLKMIVDATYPIAEVQTVLERQAKGDFKGKLGISIDGD